MRIVQITEQDKAELSELGTQAVHAMHAFLECLDKTTDGQISQEMAERYGERRGVPGTGRYSRYNRRDGGGYGGGYGERDGGSYGGGYGERYPMMREEGYERERERERGDFGERRGNSRYDY